MNKDMTTKEIAAAVGKDPATVARWIQSTSLKMQEVYRKVQEAKATSKPARYTLAEVCEIIEEGMGADVANTFRTNATTAEMVKPAAGKLNGKQMEYLYKMAAAGMISREQMSSMLGVNVAVPLQIEGPATIPERLEKQIYGIAHSVVKKYFADETTKMLNGDLFK